MRRIALTIINWEWLILLLIFFPLLFQTGWSGLFLIVIPLLWLARKIATGHFIPPTPLNLSLLILLVSILISLIPVFDIVLSFPKIAGLILGVAYYFGGLQFTQFHARRNWFLLGLILIAGTAMGFIGIMLSPVLRFSRIFSLLDFLPGTNFSQIAVNSNEIAGIMCWVVPLALAASIILFRNLWKSGGLLITFIFLISIILLFLDVTILLLSESRGGIFSVVLAVFIMFIISVKKTRWVLVFGAIVASMLFFVFNPDSPIFNQFFESQGIMGDLGFAGRIEIWSRAIYGLADFPLTGMSMNGFRKVVPILYPLFSVSPDFDIAHAHNHLLQAGLDLGIPGLIAYLSIWIIATLLLWEGLKADQKYEGKILLIGISGALIAGWSFGILDAIALGARPGFLWWLILALLVSLYTENSLFTGERI